MNVMKRVLSLMLCLAMLAGVLPAGILKAWAAESDPVVVIAGSDYQASNSSTTMTNIMNQIKTGYASPFGALLGGDYDAGSVNTTAQHIENVDSTIDGVFPNISSDNRIYIQGNHENFAGLDVDGTNLMNYTGYYDKEHYSVYAINHDDFPWSGSSSKLVQGTADNLKKALDELIEDSYKKPVFVMSHLPLHYTSRGDNDYANLLFEVLNAAGNDLNIIFLFGHNHSTAYDSYLGQGSIYLKKGDEIKVAKDGATSYSTQTLNFTYMNYGYLGYIGSTDADATLTMTAFEITDTEVAIKRYSASGLHNLKAAGGSTKLPSGLSVNSDVYGSAVLSLTDGTSTIKTLAETSVGSGVTVQNEDKTVSVTAPGLTGLTVTKITNPSYDKETYSAYASYEITPVGYEQGKSAVVTITLDTADGFTASGKAVVIDVEKGTETEVSIVNGKVTFTTNHFSTYNIAQRAATGGWTYELVTSIEAGEKYVIVGNDDAVALMDDNGSFGSQTVTISGTTLTSEVELTQWTISGTSGGTIVSDQGNGLSYSSSSFNLTGAADNTFNITAADDNFTILTVRSNSYYSKYYFNYDGSGWTSKPTSTAYVRIYKLTGSGSGGSVSTSGDKWVTVTEPNPGTVTYTYTQATSISRNGQYVIVANDDEIALVANGTTMVPQGVNISGTSGSQTMTSTTELTLWTFSNTASGTVYNGTNYLYSSSNGYTFRIDDSSDTLYFVDNGNNFTIKGNSSNSGYAFYYNGSSWATSGRSSSQSVRLFQFDEAIPGDDAADGLYAKITGQLEYVVDRGLTAEQVLDLVRAKIKGYEYTGTETPGEDVTGTDITDDLEFIMASGYDGAKAGDYAVTIKYKGVTLGVAKVTVPEVAVTGCECDTSGSVRVGASGKVRTGAMVTVNLADGTFYQVPVTMDMLTGTFDTTVADEYRDLTVSFTVQGTTYTFPNFVLTVREPTSYPEYPDEGAVKVNKTATGIQFQSTGVARVELSASGIPMNQGVDVLLVLDTSSSMGFKGSLDSGTRIGVLRSCVNALIKNLKAERADGSVPDVDIAIVDFAGYLLGHGGTKLDNYIGEQVKNTAADDVGGLLTDGWVNVQNLDDNWGTQTGNITEKSGTNYDHGLEQAYNLLAQKAQEDNGTRKQFVLFMSDGAPLQYNGVNSNSLGEDWEKWILGTYTQEEVDAMSREADSENGTLDNPEFYYGNNNSKGQLHWVAEAIKGSPEETYTIVYHENYTYGEATMAMKKVPGLGATMYSVGLALEATNMPTDVAGQEAILKTIASSEDVFYSVTSAAGLQGAFDDFAGEVLMAATNARFVDQMGDSFNLQMGAIKDLNGNTVTDVENKIEIISYDIYTRADYLAGKCAENQIGVRKGTSTVLETITFNADGSEAYSDLASVGPNGEAIAAGGNILHSGVIYAAYFWYNSNDTAVEIANVDIPTGVDSSGLTTGSTNELPAETFYWKVGTIKTTELAMRYYVYLDGSMEGTRDEGSYATNNFAILYYNNYLNQPIGQPCQKVTMSPTVAWKAANVSYAFYLVDENGNIIVNQTTGETGSFAHKIAVTNPVMYKEILLNNIDSVESIEVASHGVLPDGYELYDAGARYTIEIKSDATGSWSIYKSSNTVASTYVTQYDLNDASAYSNELIKNANADFTHTVVWFAVVWKVQALPDSVVVDFGLPVDITVLGNDMFGENGKLCGVGAFSDSLNLDGHDNTLAAGFGETYTGNYGVAKIDAATGKVRYTPTTMDWKSTGNGYEKFAYAVNYGGASNPGYYYDTVTVIPATTIYYEDEYVTLKTYTKNTDGGFDEEDGWPVDSEAANVTQAEDRPGFHSLSSMDKNNIYGYDQAYGNMSTYSMQKAAKITVSANRYGTATFDFAGTGFDVIAVTSNQTGILTVQVKDESGKMVVSKIVDTYYGYIKNADGSWSITDNTTANDLYQIPVIKVSDLAYGKYSVTIRASYYDAMNNVTVTGSDGKVVGDGSYDLYLDAIRIYNPAGDGVKGEDTTVQDAYKADGEAWPVYQEIRNNVIDSATLNGSEVEINGIAFMDGVGSSAAVEDYMNYGPNNELYLAPGQAIAFNLDLTGYVVEAVHIGLKSADGNSVSYKIVDGALITDSSSLAGFKTSTLNTATDMYYDITSLKDKTIVIYNSGAAGVLSVTNIKITCKEAPADAGSVFYVSGDVINKITENMNTDPTFTPEKFVVNVAAQAQAGSKVKVTVTTDTSVAAISVNGVVITKYRQRGETRTWTVNVDANKTAGNQTIEVIAFNADGLASEAQTPVVNIVTAKSVIRDLINKIKSWLAW